MKQILLFYSNNKSLDDPGFCQNRFRNLASKYISHPLLHQCRIRQCLKAIQKDEKQSLADQTLLTKLLAYATQQKKELEYL
ncbi:hypothetical protein QNI19_07800 [Cytophagaceae bacterium DM2B3-1]|uniref:Uncharacterized protein n=1 Tax=Xanthocytophaga flava TaxID=3048013 RepID=A0ABT7CIF3_9BACT|nr:hypothetical protein [Xanthocytophaga flavus]MDJ1492832.1 hypothetical protein [Xanthocytophaga flavus]